MSIGKIEAEVARDSSSFLLGNWFWVSHRCVFKTEDEILTLRQVLNARQKHASDLKR